MLQDDISLRELRALALMLEVGSLTRAAEALKVSQPTLSKVLARLRRHFDDPLLVRVGLAMRPTPRALQILDPLRDLLAASEGLRAAGRAFDPAVSNREFTLLVTDVGMLQFVPRLVQRLEQRGPNLRVAALPLDARPFGARLEAGEADIALGAFLRPPPTLRRQSLYADRFMSVVRRDHPERGALADPEAFRAARHIMVIASPTGHAAHRRLERAFREEIAPERVQVTVTSFLAAAFLASRTDGVATIPGKLAEFLAAELNLELFEPSLSLEPIPIDQFWHERFQHDEGHRWFRAEVFDLLAAKGR